MKSAISISILCAALLSSRTIARADSWTFATTPTDGDVTGLPGETVGWGYTITNDSSTDWLVLTDLVAGDFLNGTPDAFLFDFPVLAPGGTVTEAFNPISDTGLYSLQWNSDAPIGFTDAGNFIASAEFYSGDPLSGGSFVADASDLSAPYSAIVGSGGATVPEPSSFYLVVSGMLSMALASVYRRRSRRT
jgi:hypothetical protein